MSLADRLKRLDAHSSVENEFRVRTSQGAILSVITLTLCSYLTYTELKYNLTPTKINHVHANATHVTGLHVEFDVTFPLIPCALLSVDANDPQGQAQSLHIDKLHRVWKHRLDPSGKAIGRRSRFELGGTLQERHLDDIAAKKIEENLEFLSDDEDEDECGSCYGAGAEGECCNSCDDVKRVYQRRGWLLDDISKVKQCRREKKSDEEVGEGCNIHGIVALSSGGGNLHIAPGRGLERFGNHDRMNIADFLFGAYESFNVTHTINKLRFGQEYPGGVYQLDGQTREVQDAFGMYQYYIQVVPTTYKWLMGNQLKTFQYSVTEHLRHVNPGSGRGLPGVFFFYEVAPLHVDIMEYRPGWIRFFTSVCAIVGGVFTFMGMADKWIYAWFKAGDTTLG